MNLKQDVAHTENWYLIINKFQVTTDNKHQVTSAQRILSSSYEKYAQRSLLSKTQSFAKTLEYTKPLSHSLKLVK